MNRPTKLFAIIISATLTACAVPAPGTPSITEALFGPTVSNYKPPVVDDSTWTAEQKAAFPAALADCQTLANKSISDFESTASLYSEHEMTRITEKRRAVRRECLKNRNFVVLY